MKDDDVVVSRADVSRLQEQINALADNAEAWGPREIAQCASDLQLLAARLSRRRDAVPALSDERIDALASRAGGHCVGAPATRDEERAMAVEIQSWRAGYRVSRGRR